MGSSNKTNLFLFVILIIIMIGLSFIIKPTSVVEDDYQKSLPLTKASGR